MKRGKPLVRHKPLRSGSVLPKRNRKRVAMRKERDFGTYADWIRLLPCAVPGEPRHWGRWSAKHQMAVCDAAHVRSRGAGGRSLGNLIPLCTGHHLEQHRIGVESFAAKYGIDLSAVASALAARWKEETGTE